MQPLDANSYQSSQDKPRKHSVEEVRPGDPPDHDLRLRYQAERLVDVDTDVQALAAYLSQSFQHIDLRHLGTALPRGDR